jgi:hypothetical protein
MNRIQPKIAVVIPVYKKLSEHSKSEKALIEQTKKVFKDRSLFFAGPESLSTSLNNYDRFDFICFEDEFFKDKFSYSRLLCSLQLYQTFSDYDFIQLIQTDCWLFEDKLDHFAARGFDYIGAPWMKNGFEGKPEPEVWKVGNGGFSLRKVSSFLSVINQIENTKKGTSPVFRDYGRGLLGALKKRGIRNNLRHYIKSPPGEDIFWSIYVPLVFGKGEFNIADAITAAHYSFETLPRYLFDSVTKGRLPMGCHNWEGNNRNFWLRHINE